MLLVLDATTGQNGLVQATVFAEVVDITGIVLTKLDGTAKGGIVVAVQRTLGVPVKLVGLGEGAGRPGAVRAGGVRGRPAGRSVTERSDAVSEPLVTRCRSPAKQRRKHIPRPSSHRAKRPRARAKHAQANVRATQGLSPALVAATGSPSPTSLEA